MNKDTASLHIQKYLGVQSTLARMYKFCEKNQLLGISQYSRENLHCGLLMTYNHVALITYFKSEYVLATVFSDEL